MKTNESFALPERPHSRSVQDIQQDLDASIEGLDSGKAAGRLAQFGHNRPPKAPKDSWYIRFARHFHDTLIYVLLGAAAITGALQQSP